jgi:hypothetical protein
VIGELGWLEILFPNLIFLTRPRFPCFAADPHRASCSLAPSNCDRWR